MSNEIPRPEHPRPQFVRDMWCNLNGAWRFAFDPGMSGLERDWVHDPAAFDREIVVPFCPESRLSGIEHKDFMRCIWYRRSFDLPSGWNGMRIFLHFGAVDFDCRAWVNGEFVGRHYGGSSSFSFEISDAVRESDNEIILCVFDDVRSSAQPSGKQCPEYYSHGCLYTRVTGIWQTVWLEARPATFIDDVFVVPDIEQGRMVLIARFDGDCDGIRFRATALAEGTVVGCCEEAARNGCIGVLPLDSVSLWSPESPFLYDLRFDLLEGDEVVDTVRSYAGLREVRIDGHRILLNGKPVFLRFVLDQGFYPDGIWTAPSDAELRADIERAQAVGFNGARLHQKVFEERFHYWADRLGYLTWGEYSDWGKSRDFADPMFVYCLQNEWREVLLRDRNHPSIIAWTPTNETEASARRDLAFHRRVISDLVRLSRALDPTRPVNDSSGYVHVDTDIFTVHDYTQDPAEFAEHYAALTPEARTGFHYHFPEHSSPYRGQPFVVDEYGGTWWRPDGRPGEGGWGYGQAPASIEEVYQRMEGLTRVLTGHPYISGFCYTQLTDVEQEENGIYTYERRLKFDPERLRAIFGAPSALERESDSGSA